VTGTQPDEVTAFLATAEYAITQAAKDITDGTGESLRSTATHYAPRLLAAVEAALDLTDNAVRAEHPTLGGMVLAAFGAELQEAISRELLGEG
jgi:hypothetical protein